MFAARITAELSDYQALRGLAGRNSKLDAVYLNMAKCERVRDVRNIYFVVSDRIY